MSPGAAVVGHVLRLPRYRVCGPQGMVLDKGSGTVRVPVRVRRTGRALLTRCPPQPGGLAPAPALSFQPLAPRRLQRGGVRAQMTVRRSTPSPAESKCASTWMLRCVCTRVCTYVLCVRGCVRAACERQIRGRGAPRPTAPPPCLSLRGVCRSGCGPWSWVENGVSGPVSGWQATTPFPLLPCGVPTPWRNVAGRDLGACSRTLGRGGRLPLGAASHHGGRHPAPSPSGSVFGLSFHGNPSSRKHRPMKVFQLSSF